MVEPLPSHPDPDCKWVILDTDPGIDDAMALLCLAMAPAIDLHSLTTVFGNADVDVVTQNALFLVDRFGLDVPVFRGAAEPLEGERHQFDLHVHGRDGLGDTGMARLSSQAPSEGVPAWQHIVQTVVANPGQISLLAIGPLTNLALALRHDPRIAGLAKEVIVMGGAFGSNGRFGNIRPHAEANFYQDAVAADEVLAAPWPVTVVGLDVSADCILPSETLRAMAEVGGTAGTLLHAISRGYEDIYRTYDGIDGCCIHDVAAAAYLCAPELFAALATPLRVERDGHLRGQSSAAASGSGRPLQQYCFKVDADRVIDLLVEAVRRFDARQPLMQRSHMA